MGKYLSCMNTHTYYECSSNVWNLPYHAPLWHTSHHYTTLKIVLLMMSTGVGMIHQLNHWLDLFWGGFVEFKWEIWQRRRRRWPLCHVTCDVNVVVKSIRKLSLGSGIISIHSIMFSEYNMTYCFFIFVVPGTRSWGPGYIVGFMRLKVLSVRTIPYSTTWQWVKDCGTYHGWLNRGLDCDTIHHKLVGERFEQMSNDKNVFRPDMFLGYVLSFLRWS
jgi:hypothetical protein